MTIKCPKCGEICESETAPAVGRRIQCPFCLEKYPYEEWMSGDGAADAPAAAMVKEIPGLPRDAEAANAVPLPANVPAPPPPVEKKHEARKEPSPPPSTAAKAASAPSAGRSGHETGTGAWRRRFAYVRYRLAHWALTIALVGAAAYGVWWLYGKIREMEPTPPPPVEVEEPQPEPGEDARPDGLLAAVMDLRRVRQEYETARKRFFTDCGVADDVKGWIAENGEAWVVFDRHSRSSETNTIYHAKAENGEVCAVAAMHSAETPPETIAVSAFLKRLESEPCAVAVASGELRLCPKGRYAMPPHGGGFCIKRANLNRFYYGLGVNNIGLAPVAKYKVSLQTPTDKVAVADGAGYAENIEWREIAAKLAVRRNIARVDDPRIDKELRSSWLVVDDGASEAGDAPTPSDTPDATTPPEPPIIKPTDDGIRPRRRERHRRNDSADTARATVSGLMLSLDNPKSSSHSDKSREYEGYASWEETTTWKHSYKGKVSGIAPRGVRVPVKVEALFVTTPIGGGTAKMEIRETRTILDDFLGSGEGGSPTSHKFEFDAPETQEVQHKEKHWVHNGWHLESRTEGERYAGVILRLWVDGEIKSVKTKPSNRNWEKAAMSPSFSLD